MAQEVGTGSWRSCMMKSCKYCGRVHPAGEVCPQMPARRSRKEYTQADYFRRSQRWTDKALEIKERDKYMCQICIRNLHMNDALSQFNYRKLSVHHAVPLNDDYDRRLDNDNLITLCSYHHKMAEEGLIALEEIFSIIEEQEERTR